MSDTGYVVRWRGETYSVSDLTDKVKHRYCVWLYGHMLDNAKVYKKAKDFVRFERQLTASPPEWTSLPDFEVLDSFNKPPGRRQLLRLLLDLSDDPADPTFMAEEDLEAMVAEKSADPDSDLNRAMRLVGESADPKARGAARSSPAPAAGSEPTPPSATTPSS